jgi:alkylated DNA repair dioxygenase AlkB
MLISQPLILIDSHNSKVIYQPNFIEPNECQRLFDYFLNQIDWVHDQAVIYGKLIITKRKIAWYGDSGFDYNYSGRSRIALPWSKELLNLKKELELQTHTTYNSCLLNLYHNGTEGMAFHGDDQNHLAPDSSVAIISLGAERFFKLRETKNRHIQNKILLEVGSLLLMEGETQKHFQHEIPKMAQVKTPRISLTWRRMK